MRRLLLAMLVATTSFVSSTSAGCEQTNFDEIVASFSCGDNKRLKTCLSSGVDLDQLHKLEQCFVASGCDEASAIVSASWFAKECSDIEGSGLRDDLRKRAATVTPQQTNTEKTAAHTTLKGTFASTTAPLTTVATTAADSSISNPSAAVSSPPSSAAPSTTTPATTSDTTTTSTTTDSTTTATTTGSSQSSLVCSTTTTISTTVCSVSARQTLWCSPTYIAVPTCAAGNLCFKDNLGEPICMKIDNHLTSSGLAVAITFGVVVVGFAITLIVLKVQAKKNSRRAELIREAQFGGPGYGNRKYADVEAADAYKQARKAPGFALNPREGMHSDANLPLIAPGGARSDQQQYNQQDYFAQTMATGSNSASPGGRGRGAASNTPPKLHQGLAGLGGDIGHGGRA